MVAGGVVLMVLGGFMFLVVPTSASSYQAGGANPISIGLLGAIIGFIGFLVFIAGLAASPDRPPERVIYRDRGGGWHDPDWAPPDPTRSTRSPPTPVPPPVTDTVPSPPTPAAPPGTASAPPGIVPGITTFCPYCGTRGRSEFKFCRGCGKEFPHEA